MNVEPGKVGDRVLVRSNEIGPPLVGIYDHDEPICMGKSTVPCVVDDEGKEWYCGGIVVKYNDELHDHLKSMSDSKDGWYYLCRILHPDSVDGKRKS